jgi:hypothetical protein
MPEIGLIINKRTTKSWRITKFSPVMWKAINIAVFILDSKMILHVSDTIWKTDSKTRLVYKEFKQSLQNVPL